MTEGCFWHTPEAGTCYTCVATTPSLLLLLLPPGPLPAAAAAAVQHRLHFLSAVPLAAAAAALLLIFLSCSNLETQHTHPTVFCQPGHLMHLEQPRSPAVNKEAKFRKCDCTHTAHTSRGFQQTRPPNAPQAARIACSQHSILGLNLSSTVFTSRGFRSTWPPNEHQAARMACKITQKQSLPRGIE